MSGFYNWKDGTRCFNRHEGKVAHKAAVDFTITIHAGMSRVGDMLSTAHAEQKASNRHYLIKVAQNITFLARQGIAFHGDSDESDGNFMQLLHLRALNDSKITDKSHKYASPQIQNELYP